MAETNGSARPQIGVGGFQISQRAKDLVAEVMDSNRITSGPKMERFEQEMARLHDCRFAVMTNSGTSCLHVALAALKETRGWEDEDEVLVPAVTFVATSNVVMYNGLTPVFVDVEPDYYTMDPTKLADHLTERTRAIMPVHLSGLPCDMDPIMEFAEEHDLAVVEDSAETMFSRYKGRAVGSFGDIACFSTYAAHIITTGVGGLCTTNDPDLIVLLKSLINHGRDSIYIRMDDDKETEDIFEVANRRFSFVRLGHSFRATEMEAALGIAEIENHEQSVARRQAIAGRLTEGLSDLGEFLQLPAIRSECDHTFMFYPIVLLEAGGSRDDLIRYLEEHSIETRYLLPLINQPIYRDLFGDLDSEYPVAARLNERAFYIGSHPALNDEEIEYVIDQFHAYFEGS
jgi:perosamine synthetase